MKFVKRRQAKADAKSTDGDLESQTTPNTPLTAQSDSTPRTRPATAGSRSTSSTSSSTGSNLATILLRKLILGTARDVTENPQGNYLLTIIKDVISGTILGVFFLMILIFLDYQNIVQLGSARAFRRAAFELMTDAETVKSIEENIDVKFIPLEVYKSMTEEITRNQEKIKDNSGLKQHEDDWAKKNEELQGMKKEFLVMKEKGDKVLGLDKWCGSCKAGWGNCDVRVKYLFDTYHTPEIKAKVDIMKTGKCMK
mmetsp:Transcript_6418/g.11165  ORF Transcript_6418/g.11165 Transcript_6418/m.11165 type:complete len:254 (-) Transcript_6418:211-972(-)